MGMREDYDYDYENDTDTGNAQPPWRARSSVPVGGCGLRPDDFLLARQIRKQIKPEPFGFGLDCRQRRAKVQKVCQTRIPMATAVQHRKRSTSAGRM
jgi:hypothetical protein